MTINIRLAAVVACCAIVATPAFAYTSKDRYASYRPHYWSHSYGGSVHRNAAGDLISSDGWRLRSNAKGWDNTCFNLDYLPSEFACSAR